MPAAQPLAATHPLAVSVDSLRSARHSHGALPRAPRAGVCPGSTACSRFFTPCHASGPCCPHIFLLETFRRAWHRAQLVPRRPLGLQAWLHPHTALRGRRRGPSLGGDTEAPGGTGLKPQSGLPRRSPGSPPTQGIAAQCPECGGPSSTRGRGSLARGRPAGRGDARPARPDGPGVLWA